MQLPLSHPPMDTGGHTARVNMTHGMSRQSRTRRLAASRRDRLGKSALVQKHQSNEDAAYDIWGDHGNGYRDPHRPPQMQSPVHHSMLNARVGMSLFMLSTLLTLWTTNRDRCSIPTCPGFPTLCAKCTSDLPYSSLQKCTCSASRSAVPSCLMVVCWMWLGQRTDHARPTRLRTLDAFTLI